MAPQKATCLELSFSVFFSLFCGTPCLGSHVKFARQLSCHTGQLRQIRPGRPNMSTHVEGLWEGFKFDAAKVFWMLTGEGPPLSLRETNVATTIGAICYSGSVVTEFHSVMR